MASLPDFFLKSSPWTHSASPIWPATVFLLKRNHARHLFPHKLENSQLEKLLPVLSDPLIQSPLVQESLLLKAEELAPVDREFLFEHFLCLQGLPNIRPGQAFILDRTTQFLATINQGDHLQLRMMDSSGKWGPLFERLYAIETAIHLQIPFATHPSFGFLTANPLECGSGLFVYVYLHLPGLIHTGKLSEILSQEKDQKFTLEGLRGKNTDYIGDLVILSLPYTLGMNEETHLKLLQKATQQLVVAEKTLRHTLTAEQERVFKDFTSRSFGLLKHSYLLEVEETLSALGWMKWGIDMGWVKGLSDQQINEIFFQCQRAGLFLSEPAQISSDAQELVRKRAQLLHEKLQVLTLEEGLF